MTKRIVAVATVLTIVLVPQVASAACRWVKVDPTCWGDTCPTRKVCRSETITLEHARQQGSRPWISSRNVR